MINNNNRVRYVLSKISRGESVNIIAFGGSITTGYASDPIKEKSWAALTGKWLEKKAEKYGSDLHFMNEGVSGTDSAFASVRVKDHIIKNKADLVILEFAMNDQWLDPSVRRRSYEGVIRQIMNNSSCAVLALFVNERNVPFKGQQYEQQPICEYYNIPFVSWKDCLAADHINDFDHYFTGTEYIHPNNYGHESIAKYVTEKLETIWNGLPQDLNISGNSEILPVPLTDTDFEFTTLYSMSSISPLENNGWNQGSPVHPEWVEHGNVQQGWNTKNSDAEILFNVKGSSIGIMYAESDQYRNSVAFITFPDGTRGKDVVLECYQENRQGYLGWAYRELVKDFSIKEYTLHIKVQKSNKDEEGRYTNFTGIVVTGNTGLDK